MTDKPMNMVEKVARAVLMGRLGPVKPDAERFEELWDRANQDQFLSDARAAIAAMREPTEEMEISAMKKLSASDFVANQARYNRWTWQAYIDTALSEPEGVKE